MKRIAHVIHGSPASSMGGTGLYVEALAQAQAKDGHATAIVAPDRGGSTRKTNSEGPVEEWSVGMAPVRSWAQTWSPSTDAWKAWCAEWKPDVVHVHHLSGWPLNLVAATPCKTVLTLHDYAIPCARGQLVTLDLSLCEGPNPQACTACLGPALNTHPVLLQGAKILARAPRIYAAIRRLYPVKTGQVHPDVQARLLAAGAAIDAADVLLSPSKDLANRMETFGFRRPEHTSLPLVQPTCPVVIPKPGPVRFLFASSIIPTKGVDRLIRAFARLQDDATLTIAGHSPPFDGHPRFAASLEQAVQSIPGIDWLGAIEPQAVTSLIATHDVLVLPSIWPENSPLIVREASAQGLHIIGPKLGGTKELVPEADCVGDEVELFEALKNAVRRGRTRLPPKKWPSPAEHAAQLISQVY